MRESEEREKEIERFSDRERGGREAASTSSDADAELQTKLVLIREIVSKSYHPACLIAYTS